MIAARGLLRRFSGARWPILDQAMVSAANFATNLVIARDLGVTSFGVYTLGWSAVLLLMTLQFALINAPMFSFAARLNPEERSGYFAAMIRRGAGFSALGFLVLLTGCLAGGALVADWPFSACALPLAAAGSLYVWQDFTRRALFASGHAATAFVADIVSYPLQLLILAIALGHGLTLSRLLWVVAATSAAASLLAVSRLAWQAPIGGAARASLARHWEFSRWIVGSVATNWLVINFFTIVVGILLGAAAAAHLRAALLLFAIGNVILLGLDNFLPGRAADLLHQQGWSAFASFMRFWVLASLALSLAIAVMAVAAPRFWLTLAFGDELKDAAPLVPLCALVYPLTVFVTSMGVLLRAAADTRAIFDVWLAMAVVGLLSAFPAVHYFALPGAIAAQGLSYGVGSMLMIIRVRRLSRSGRA